MADLNEIKDINADLPLTKFPDEVDDFESFSDADEEINSVIIKYNNLIKQGETASAEELYNQYSLKKYIVSAYFLNKIQQMIIACERSISSVKKYFSFSVEQPTSTTSQPNGYIWGKILTAGDYFKKVVFKLKDNGKYVNIYPQTTSDNVLMSESEGETETVKDILTKLSEDLENTIDIKMDKDNPSGTGSLGMNLGDALIGGEGFNSVSLGTCNTSVGKNSMAFGSECQVLANNAIAEGFGLNANVPNQHVSGKYNEAGNYAQIIGNGTSKTDRKNIYTVDWDGNVKGNSFTATSDIIYDDGKSLKALNENFEILKTSNESISKAVTEHNKLLSNNFVIKSISSGSYDTSVNGGAVSEGERITFNIEVNMDVNDNLILIPYYTSKHTNADLRMFSSNTSTKVIGTSKTLTVTATLENISSGEHNLIVYWYAIIYTKLNAY